MAGWGLHLTAAGLTALMLGLAFPEPGWWWIAYVALVPAGVMAARSRRPWVLLATSWLAFLAFWLVRIGWVAPVATTGGYLALSGLMALWLAGGVWLAWVLMSKWGLVSVLALPAAWVTMELGRSSLIAGGFGWFVLGHSQAPWRVGEMSRVVQIADLFGELGVSFFVAMTNGLIVDLLTRPLVRVDSGKARARKTITAAVVLWLAAGMGTWVYGAYRLGEVTDERGPVIAVVQTDVMLSHAAPRDDADEAADWAELLRLTVEAARSDPPPMLVVWPETMTPAPVNAEARAMAVGGPGGIYGSRLVHEQIAQFARELGVSILVGSGSIDELAEVAMPGGETGLLPSKRANSVHLYSVDGAQSPQRYDKMHLVPFGEYVPWVGGWPWAKDRFMAWFSPWGVDYTLTPGGDPVVFEVQAPIGTYVLRTATPVCYEDASPGVVRRMVYGPDGRKRADLLANMTNAGWYPGTGQRWQQLQIATLRCVENRVPMVRSVNTGVSAVIDSGGVVRAALAPGAAGWLSEPVRPDGRSSLYGALGRWPAVVLAGLTLAAAFGGLLRRGTIKSSARH